MFTFVDGRPLVLPFKQVEQLFYQAFLDRFPESPVSKTQFVGSYEYQTLYPAMQMMVENGELTFDALNHVLDSIAQANQLIYRPAVLQDRVSARFAQEGIEATSRVADATTKGILAICVDQASNPEVATDQFVGNLIRDEILPAGQHMEGDITWNTSLNNGQSIAIKWTNPIDNAKDYRVNIQRRRGSPYPEDPVDDIIAKFNTNYNAIMGIGTDITPQLYLTVRDLPWASSVLVEWYDGTTWYSTDLAAPYNTRYLANLAPANVVIT